MKPRPKFYMNEARRAVLRVLYEAKEPQYGVAISMAAERPHGTVYPILRRFSERGWVISIKEPSPLSAPPRIYYRLSPLGRQQAKILLQEN